MSTFKFTFINENASDPPKDRRIKTQDAAKKTPHTINTVPRQNVVDSTPQSKEGTVTQQDESKTPQKIIEKVVDYENGYLQIQAQEDVTHEALSGANVTVWTDNEDKVLFQLLTDEYGKTRTVALPAPARRYSLDIKSLIIPYSTYTVEIKYNAHSTNLYRHIQVFADTTTIQICNITLLPENVNPENVTVLPPHILVVKEPK